MFSRHLAGVRSSFGTGWPPDAHWPPTWSSWLSMSVGVCATTSRTCATQKAAIASAAPPSLGRRARDTGAGCQRRRPVSLRISVARPPRFWLTGTMFASRVIFGSSSALISASGAATAPAGLPPCASFV